MDWRVTTLIWITRLTGLGLVLYFLEPVFRQLELFVGLIDHPPIVHTEGGTRPFTSLEWVGYFLDRLPDVLLFLLGLYLLLGGRWLTRRMLRGLDGTCPACGHPWPDSGVNRCHECGFGAGIKPLPAAKTDAAESESGAGNE